MITLFDYDVLDEYKFWLSNTHGIKWDYENVEGDYRHPYWDYCDKRYAEMTFDMDDIKLDYDRILIIKDSPREGGHRQCFYYIDSYVANVLDLFETIDGYKKQCYVTKKDLKMESILFDDEKEIYTFRGVRPLMYRALNERIKDTSKELTEEEIKAYSVSLSPEIFKQWEKLKH